MSVREQSLKVVLAAIDDLNAQLSEQPPIQKSPETVLFGEGGSLNSLALVNLIALVEELAEDEYNMPLTLADERAFSEKQNPFRTVGALSKYLATRVEESQNA